MLQHYRDVHLNHRPHTCMHCSRQYSKEYDLKRHIQVVHNKNRPYECQMCDRTFSTAFQMRQHMQYHTGNFRYRCPVCEKVFVNAQALAKHARNSKMCLQKEPALAKIGGCSQHLLPPPPPDQILNGPVPDLTIGLPPPLPAKVEQQIAAVPAAAQHNNRDISAPNGSHPMATTLTPLHSHQLIEIRQTVDSSIPHRQQLPHQQNIQHSPLPLNEPLHQHHQQQHHQLQNMQPPLQEESFPQMQQQFGSFSHVQRIYADPVKPTALLLKFPYL